ncbi:6-O-methylguanine DNA methyltransferase [Niveispirillum lacus]|uniref:methylated-DNA--[protein]-cysteine S-methyltransferase n=1 Tax=Niveispirillum lacus TaxID=1981099 RepID=A0A255Z1Q2_9PROT|nr:methylated-DNA--[protein]-cysteine S-methyltransferase [Niveispirillum lacus]OYQ35382.1 6-O-methylguanine DNA methyltransferase [Niveispirillum lacus]
MLTAKNPAFTPIHAFTTMEDRAEAIVDLCDPQPVDGGARLVADALRRLARDWQQPPSLAELAADAGLTQWHFQRLFKRWAGISPKRFSQFATLGHARGLLRRDGDNDLLGASLDLGLSGPSRLHDLFVVAEGVTPGEYKAAGKGMVIRWALHRTALGAALLAATDRGVCWFGFTGEGDDPADQLTALIRDWPHATLIEDPTPTQAAAASLDPATQGQGPLTLHLKGTNFQMRVWRALLDIPFGSVATYAGIADRIGQPGAARAVGNAVGANKVAWLIPCHRVIRGTGILDNYRWGPVQKRTLLAWEAARLAGE